MVDFNLKSRRQTAPIQQCSRQKKKTRMLSRSINRKQCNNHNESLNGMAMVDALFAKDTMFKATFTQIPCPWPIHVVPSCKFAFPSPSSICMPPELPQRSFEYGASWVEHYYSRFIVECQKRRRMDLVKMLYHWYVAQFTLDYLNDAQPLSSEQFLAASNVLSDTRSLNTLNDEAHSVCMDCRTLMIMHDKALNALPAGVSVPIFSALDDFYASVAKQCTMQEEGVEIESTTLHEYMDYRTLNAGGLMGFVRQIRLLSLLDPDFPVGDLDTVSRLVGLNIALMNDLYGVKKDALSGEPNIVLKHAREMQCGVNESVAWASECIKATVKDVECYCKLYPNCICTKYNVAMSCISGNHGFHESSKRYQLPDGFSWIGLSREFPSACCKGDECQ